MQIRSIRVAAAILGLCLAISGCGGSDSPSSTGLQDVPGAVVAPPPAVGTGSATLDWTPPTANDDGTALTNLAGYKIYFGGDPNALVQSVQITNPGLTTYVMANLGAGTTYFTMTAYNTSGVESARTLVGSKTI